MSTLTIPESKHPVESLIARVKHFVDTEILPQEVALARGDDDAARRLTTLTEAAKKRGLWGSFFPPPRGGRVDTLEAYLPIARQEGRTEFSHTIFASHSAVDARMLENYGSAPLKQQFLLPLIAGNAVSSYGMTEPGQPGSVPAAIACRAEREGDYWRINGRKWFICNADRATFVTVLAHTHPRTERDPGLSMLIVPTQTPGFRVERQISVLGRFQSQGEMSFNDVRIPATYLLGEAGQGLQLMRSRLRIGRLVRAFHWLGLAQRCFELACRRIHSRRGQTARLAGKQLIRQHIFDIHTAVESAGALLLTAAKAVDRGEPGDVKINLAKVAASRALCQAADSAVQIYGAEGVSDFTPLSGIYRVARTSRLLDGADEVLISSVGRALIDAHADGGEEQC